MAKKVNIIIPLAGPDLLNDNINERYLKEINKSYYLKYCINKRFYNNNNYDLKYHFIILECGIKKKIINKIESNFDVENLHTIENVQNGAAYTIKSYLDYYGKI